MFYSPVMQFSSKELSEKECPYKHGEGYKFPSQMPEYAEGDDKRNRRMN